MHRYLVALGSNRRHVWAGSPREVVGEALAVIDGLDCDFLAASPIIDTPPLGPSARNFANAAALLETDREPEAMLTFLKLVELAFGRRTQGQRWSSRVLDLDIVVWSGGMFASKSLLIPHPHFRHRGFVTAPVALIAPDWRDPVSGLTLRQLHARLTSPRPVTRAPLVPSNRFGALSSVGRATDF